MVKKAMSNAVGDAREQLGDLAQRPSEFLTARFGNDGVQSVKGGCLKQVTGFFDGSVDGVG
jgi:hypothetical protein